MRGYPQFSFLIPIGLANICFSRIVINRTKIFTVLVGIVLKSLPAAELDHHLLSICQFIFFMNVCRTNGEFEPATFSSFQRNIQRYLSVKKYPFNILKDYEFEKLRRVLAAKHKSLINEHDRRNKLQAAQAIRCSF